MAVLWRNIATSDELEEGGVDGKAGHLYGDGGLVEGTYWSMETVETCSTDSVATGETDWGPLGGLQVLRVRQAQPLALLRPQQSTEMKEIMRKGKVKACVA